MSRTIAITVFIALTGCMTLHAQVTGKLKMSYEQPETIAEGYKTQGFIQCRVDKGVLPKNEPNARLVVYAQNNLRNVPMTLMLNEKSLKVKRGVGNIIFGVPYDDIFFTKKSDKGYSWKWHARGRVPLSPIAPIAKKEVSNVQVWATLHYNAEIYISDTITIDVQ